MGKEVKNKKKIYTPSNFKPVCFHLFFGTQKGVEQNLTLLMDKT